MSLSAPVRRWLDATLGPFRELESRSHAVRIEAAEGACWVKVYPSGRAWRQSERAFAVIVPALDRAGVPVPRPIAQNRRLRARVLSEVPGRAVTFDDDPRPFSLAADVLARLHRIPCVQDPMPLSVALRQRAAAWALRPSAPPGASAIVAWVELHAGALAADRVWCHRDYHPRNWLFDDASLGVVDFEHTRPDHPLVDWVRLEGESWSAGQRATFVAALGEPDPDALRGVLAIYGLATWVWAREHRDVGLAAAGRRALARAGFPLDPSTDSS